MRTLTCPPEAETIGVNITAFFDNLRDDNTKPIMEKYGLLNIDPESWFPLSKYLDALNELAERPDFSSNLVAIGLEIGSMTPLPPDLEDPTLEDVLMHWNDMYQMLHRGADVGKIVIKKISDTHYKTIHTVVFPDDLSYGVLYGYARRFLSPGTRFTVYYDEDVLPRDKGGTEGCTIIHIAWQ